MPSSCGTLLCCWWMVPWDTAFMSLWTWSSFYQFLDIYCNGHEASCKIVGGTSRFSSFSLACLLACLRCIEVGWCKIKWTKWGLYVIVSLQNVSIFSKTIPINLSAHNFQLRWTLKFSCCSQKISYQPLTMDLLLSWMNFFRLKSCITSTVYPLCLDWKIWSKCARSSFWWWSVEHVYVDLF